VYSPVDHAGALPQNQSAVEDPVSSVDAVPAHQPLPEMARCVAHNRPCRVLLGALLLTLALAVTGCHKHSARVTPPPPPPPEPALTVKNRPAPTTPAPSPLVDPNAKVIWSQVGWASWYGPNYHNKQGANGEIYDQNGMTAAHNTLPLNSIVRVVNLKSGQSTVVRITDRGPFVGDRIIDLSVAAAKALNVYLPGTAQVRLDVLEAPHPIETGGRWCVQMGAFKTLTAAADLKEHLQHRYPGAQVLQFKGPTGYWVRIRVAQDDKDKTREVYAHTRVEEGGIFMVRLD
jgi:rare lipoprotein A